MRTVIEPFRIKSMGGFPPNYQVVVRCTISGMRLISYQYETHVIVDKPLDTGR